MGVRTDPTRTDDAVVAARPRATLDESIALGELVARLFGKQERPCLQRYHLRRRLGAGGMAVVFAGWDPHLSREVAIKLQPGRRPGSCDAERLMLEARLLGSLHHPNVVAVYDVGRYGAGDLPRMLFDDGAAPIPSGVFVVMELVRGIDLAQWLAHAPRSRAEILARFIAAGRGLAYAHDHGVVHRDFKPANVVLGDDGVAKVVDFGLACFPGLVAASTEPSARTLTDERLTRTGAVLGTPAYMAPEQHRGEIVDARADQFAFCASLFEALTGVRPFVGDDLDTLHEAKRAGVPRGCTGRLPRSMLAALLRGMDPDPRQRFATMHELLRALEPSRPRVRARRSIAFALIVLAVATGANAHTAAPEPILAAPIVAPEDGDTSEAAHGDEPSPATPGHDADADPITRIRHVLAQTEANGDHRSHAEAAVRYGAMLERQGELATASRVLTDAFFEADTAGAPLVAARAAALLVAASGREGSRDGITTWARHARAQLQRVGGDAELDEFLANNLGIATMFVGDLPAAADHYRHALALREVAAPNGDARTAAYLDNLGAVLQDLGHADEAEPLHRRALELTVRELGGDHPNVATIACNLARLAYDAGRPDDALAHARHAFAIASAREHAPALLTSSFAMGAALLDLQRPEEARVSFDRGLAILGDEVPADDPQRLRLRAMRAIANAKAGHDAAARREAIAVLESLAAAGPEDPSVAELRAIVAGA